LIYWRIDVDRLIEALKNTSPEWLMLALAMVVPLTLFAAWRLQQLMPSGTSLGFAHAVRLILAASGLNMILPSKMGDIAKAYFMERDGHLPGPLALSLVVFEKTTDMLALLVWCLFGLLVYPNKDWVFWSLTGLVGLGLAMAGLMLGSGGFARLVFAAFRRVAPGKVREKLGRLEESWLEMLGHLRHNRRLATRVLVLSVFIWFLHLLQIWFFILALRAWTPLVANLALAPLAILVGLLPFTFAGIGTRDAAVVFFYRPFLSPPVAAALGFLFTLRYLVPAIAGLPILGRYMAEIPRLRAGRGEAAARSSRLARDADMNLP
jgi:uncharacterized protein (TIRG00374 family)